MWILFQGLDQFNSWVIFYSNIDSKRRIWFVHDTSPRIVKEWLFEIRQINRININAIKNLLKSFNFRSFLNFRLKIKFPIKKILNGYFPWVMLGIFLVFMLLLFSKINPMRFILFYRVFFSFFSWFKYYFRIKILCSYRECCKISS